MTHIISRYSAKNAPPITKRRVKRNGRIFFAILILVIIGYAMGIMTSLAFSYQSHNEPITYINETVRRGDTLWTIADRYCDNSTNIQEYIHKIAKLNNLDSNYSLAPGQELLIPTAESAKHN
ncbi:MAG: LysM peptidoglycan-binding domain-containing protein [Negativicutes bacterium]|jgi:hypothetical protein